MTISRLRDDMRSKTRDLLFVTISRFRNRMLDLGVYVLLYMFVCVFVCRLYSETLKYTHKNKPGI